VDLLRLAEEENGLLRQKVASLESLSANQWYSFRTIAAAIVLTAVLTSLANIALFWRF
jgi:hypothetical protein